ncbi:MAG: MAC/perforin domain-containing protein [Gammaproteobacteria bacterium]
MDLNGNWAYDQRQIPDDNAAIKKGNTNVNGKAALHGTWIRMRYFVIRAVDKEPGDNACLTVFDEEGNFCQFIKTDDGTTRPTWASQSDAVTFPFPGTTDSRPPLKAASRKVYPTLVLTKYDESNCPGNKHPGDLYIASAGDPSSAHTQSKQTITYHPDDDIFYWSSGEYGNGLLFNRVAAQVGPTDGPIFADTFGGQSDFTQVAFPFYGFDPRYMKIYSAAGYYETPGTSLVNKAYPSNPGQLFIAPLIFNFPTGDSRDYVRYIDLPHQPNLPIGRYGQIIETEAHQEHGAMVSKISDRLNSWSVTLGLSAGIEKMLSGGLNSTFSDKIEEQRQNESRYTVARIADIYWANIIDIPSLQLKDEFVSWIKDITHTHMAGASPDWDAFVAHYGTHYLHTMTQGQLEYTETRFSLQSEAAAHTKGFNLKTESKAVLNGGKVSGKDEIAAEWSQKLGSTLDSKDVQSFSIGKGTTSGVAILYDLRPMTELLSPIFFPYNPADDWQRLAPWVWSEVRESFASHLETLGLNQSLDESLEDDYTPRLVKVTFPAIKVSTDDRRWLGNNSAPLYAIGSITLEDLDGDPSRPDEQFHLTATNYNPDKQRVDGNGHATAETEFSCLLALRKGKKPRLKLNFDDLYLVFGDEPWMERKDAGARFANQAQVIEADMNDKIEMRTITPIQVKEFYLEIYYTLHIDIRWEEIGLLQ